jgi:hypothetical protein
MAIQRPKIHQSNSSGVRALIQRDAKPPVCNNDHQGMQLHASSQNDLLPTIHSQSKPRLTDDLLHYQEALLLPQPQQKNNYLRRQSLQHVPRLKQDNLQTPLHAHNVDKDSARGMTKAE